MRAAMAVAPPEGIYRAMIEENGVPKLGSTATALGIRKGKDIVPDNLGMVHRPKFNPGAENGLSCAPTIQTLPGFALPLEWGGLNQRTSVWVVESVVLGPHLIAQEDTVPNGRRHISIGPARTMTFDEFVNAIEATKFQWKKVART
jgi:hypothetical protein